MLITLLLVVGVIYLFLHNASATLIPALALPFSILGTFAVMAQFQTWLQRRRAVAPVVGVATVHQ